MLSNIQHMLIVYCVCAFLFGSGSCVPFWLESSVTVFSDEPYQGCSIFENHPPFTPSNPIPANGSVEESIDIVLLWQGGDPDGDNVYYDVYFEAEDSTPDVRVSYHQRDTWYDPGLLAYDTEYYWQIVAYDQFLAETEGPIWYFSTKTYPVPNLECDGKLVWTRVHAGSEQQSSFLVRNLGDLSSLLSWEVESCPEWGNWTFNPMSSSNLTPEMGGHTIEVSVVVPDERFQEFSGEVRVVNRDNRSDYDIVIVSISTPFQKPVDPLKTYSID